MVRNRGSRWLGTAVMMMVAAVFVFCLMIAVGQTVVEALTIAGFFAAILALLGLLE